MKPKYLNTTDLQTWNVSGVAAESSSSSHPYLQPRLSLSCSPKQAHLALTTVSRSIATTVSVMKKTTLK